MENLPFTCGYTAHSTTIGYGGRICENPPCPYPNNSPEACEWQAGFTAAETEYEKEISEWA